MRLLGTARRARGFTLIELLVVIAIIGVLVALLLPAVQSARESARRTQCTNNLKQLGIAMQEHHDTNHAFPNGWAGEFWNPVDNKWEASGGWAWGVRLLPYLEQVPLHDSANFSFNVSDPESRTIRSTVLSCFVCPTSTGKGPVRFGPKHPGATRDLAAGQYVGNEGAFDIDNYRTDDTDPLPCFPDGHDGVLFQDSAVAISDITDGTSNTFLVGERSRNVADATWVGVPIFDKSAVWIGTKSTWSRPNKSMPASVAVLGRTGPFPGITDPNCPEHIPPDPRIGTPNRKDAGLDEYNSQHPGGCNFLFCDGSVRFIRDGVRPQPFRYLATIANGEAISADQF